MHQALRDHIEVVPESVLLYGFKNLIAQKKDSSGRILKSGQVPKGVLRGLKEYISFEEATLASSAFVNSSDGAGASATSVDVPSVNASSKRSSDAVEADSSCGDGTGGGSTKRSKTAVSNNMDILHSLLLKCETQKERDLISNVLQR